MKTRFFQAEMKEIELKEGSIKIKGFASTPDIDRYNDIVAPKAFKKAIEGYMNNPVILLQHNSDKPIGKTIDYKISGKGLNITVELTNDIDNVFKNIQDGILKGFSIGFIPKKWEYKMNGDKEVREITEIDLIEVSVVSTPANATSLFTLSKSIKSFFEEIKEDSYINNTNVMKENIKEVEEVKEEIVEETKENDVEVEQNGDVEEVIEEGTNVTNPDEVENSDESSDEDTETAEEETEETDENSEETVEEETEEVENDEAGSELEKDFEAMKKELAEHKELVSTLLDTVIAMSEKTLEIKTTVDAMPIRKGLATMGGIEIKSQDPLVKALFDAKENY